MKMADRATGRYSTVDKLSNGEISEKEKEEAETHSSKDEIREWMTVNRKMRKQGLSSVRVLPPQEVDLNTDRYVCFDLGSSQSLRTAVTSLITEVDRKDNIIQDLTMTVTKLQSEVTELTGKSAHATSKAKDIKVMLECSRARVQELEEQQSQNSSAQAASSDETERLRNTKTAMARQCRQLQSKVEEQEKELERLRREVLVLAEEDERRNKRQNQVFADFRKRASRPQSAADQRMMDIIDSYENQIHGLKKQMQANRSNSGAYTSMDEAEPFSMQPSDNFKAILKSYEKELREKDRRIRTLESEKDNAKHDLGTRPETSDYRVLALQVKQLERLLALHNICIPGKSVKSDPFLSRQKFSTRLEDLDYLPLQQCHKFLKGICCELQVDNLDCVAAVIQELKEQTCDSDRFVEYCRELSEIVEQVDEQNYHRSRLYRGERSIETVLCDSNMRYYLDVVSNWCKDISALRDLQCAINHLLDKAVPWMKAQVNSDCSVAGMAELLEQVAHADKSSCQRTVMEDVSRACLEEIVCHFQTLFDTPRICGVLPRMNEVYRVLGELRNVQNTLKCQIGLPEDAHSSALVDAVGKICYMHNSTTAKQLKRLLQTDDLNGVIRRLDEHTQFFPAFESIMQKLFSILCVDKMNEVIPAVRALKLLAS